MSAVINNSQDFLNDEEKLKKLIADGFDPDKKCHYDAMALKFQFNKLVLRVREFMLEYPQQECPDIYEHMRMLRGVSEVLTQAMEINFGPASQIELSKIGTPQGKSTPQRMATPRILVSNATEDLANSGSKSLYRTAVDSPSLLRDALPPTVNHRQMFATIYDIERTLNSLNSPQQSSPRVVPRVVKKTQVFGRLRADMPRKGLDFLTK